MRYWYGLKTKPVAWLLPILAFTLVLAVACGSAAQTTDAEPADTSGAAEPPAAVQTQPTAVPAAAPEQPAAMTEVHPGTVTWMIGGLGSENFDYTFDVGGSNNYIRFFGLCPPADTPR